MNLRSQEETREIRWEGRERQNYVNTVFMKFSKMKIKTENKEASAYALDSTIHQVMTSFLLAKDVLGL